MPLPPECRTTDRVSKPAALVPPHTLKPSACILAFAVSRLVDYNNSLCTWNDPGRNKSAQLFARQAIPMVWDFAEANPFRNRRRLLVTATLIECAEHVMRRLRRSSGSRYLKRMPATKRLVWQESSPPIRPITTTSDTRTSPISSTSGCDSRLRPVFPALFATIAVPKAEELVATPYRHGGKDKAEAFLLEWHDARQCSSLADTGSSGFPVTIYYAFKQSETDSDTGTSSTGWETFLEAVHRAGLQLTAHGRCEPSWAIGMQ